MILHDFHSIDSKIGAHKTSPKTSMSLLSKRTLFSLSEKKGSLPLLDKTTCLLVDRGDVSSCSARRQLSLLHMKPIPLVQQEAASSCSAGTISFVNKKFAVLVQRHVLRLFLLLSGMSC
jgi:hypothetical protein